VNGEATYGTGPWLVYGEGPTRRGGGGFRTSVHPSARFEQPDAIRLEPGKATCEGSLRLQVNEGRPNIGY
jgi:hypothetical protein